MLTSAALVQNLSRQHVELPLRYIEGVHCRLVLMGEEGKDIDIGLTRRLFGKFVLDEKTAGRSHAETREERAEWAKANTRVVELSLQLAGKAQAQLDFFSEAALRRRAAFHPEPGAAAVRQLAYAQELERVGDGDLVALASDLVSDPGNGRDACLLAKARTIAAEASRRHPSPALSRRLGEHLAAVHVPAAPWSWMLTMRPGVCGGLSPPGCYLITGIRASPRDRTDRSPGAAIDE